MNGPHHGKTVPATNFAVYGAFWLSVSLYALLDPSGDLENSMCYLRIILAIYTFFAMVS